MCRAACAEQHVHSSTALGVRNVCVCMRACVRACMRVCVCVRACVRVCVRARACVHACVRACLLACSIPNQPYTPTITCPARHPLHAWKVGTSARCTVSLCSYVGAIQRLPWFTAWLFLLSSWSFAPAHFSGVTEKKSERTTYWVN